MTYPRKIVINPNPLPAFKILYNLPKGTWLVVNLGGRGGGKSHETAKLAVIKAITEKKRIAVLRDEKTTINQSILNDIKSQFKRIDEQTNGYFSSKFQMNENELKEIGSNQSLIFTQGFRASSGSKETNLKSISEIDIALIEEFEDIRDENKFNVFADGIRKEGSYILINSNVPDKNHWFIKRFYNLIPSEVDGFFILQPKNIEGVVYIWSNFENNPHLPPHIIKKYRDYGDTSSNFYDKHYFYSQIMGYCSAGRTGRIYNNWKRIPWDEYKELPYNRYYVNDFGNNDPNALIEIKVYQNKIFCRGLIYEPMEVNPLGIKLAELGFTEKELIICDSAKPMSIAQLQGFNEDSMDVYYLDRYPQLRKGFNTVGVPKPAGSVVDGIRKLQQYEVYVCEDTLSDKIWDEYVDYVWELDRNKQPTDQPIDKNNHFMDCIRYFAYVRDNL